MHAKLLPVLALVIPVALTVIFWLGTFEGPSSTSRWAQSVRGTPPPSRVRVSNDPASPSVAEAFDERVATLEAHVASAPKDREMRLALARLLHDGHREHDAVEHYREALAMDPEDARVYFDLAASYGALGDWEGAAEVLVARLKVTPNDAVAMYNLGAVHANRGDMGEAESWWRRAQAAATEDRLASSAAHALARLEEARTP